jgi:hypothetical protein
MLSASVVMSLLDRWTVWRMMGRMDEGRAGADVVALVVHVPPHPPDASPQQRYHSTQQQSGGRERQGEEKKRQRSAPQGGSTPSVTLHDDGVNDLIVLQRTPLHRSISSHTQTTKGDTTSEMGTLKSGVDELRGWK